MSIKIPSGHYPVFTRVSIFLLIIALTILSCKKETASRLSVLQEDKEFLQIPGVGWQTFDRTADLDNTLSTLKFKSGCAYYRWYWVSLEPQEGQYNFAMIDDILKTCRENNQALAFRVMCEDPWGEGLPQWLIDKGIKRTYSACSQEGAHYAPDMSDPVFISFHEKLIRALGERYDGHPDLAQVDIGSVGLWGEWHIYCDPDLMPDASLRHSVVDLYYESFPNTPLSALEACIIDDTYAVNKGKCGWRADSWGDADATGGSWNHHEYFYWPTHNKYPELWKSGPVVFEPGEPGGYMDGWTVPAKGIVDDALAWHTSMVSNKSHSIPQNIIPEIERLVMKMGFRLVLRNVTFDNSCVADTEIPVTMKWENLGIAPPYRDHRIAFRLKDKNNANSGITVTDQSIQGWLPGETNITVNYKLAAGLPAGDYSLEMGVVFHNSIEHTIPIANKGKTDDGWYSLGKIKINN
ncbi:MAG: DUF4832 domain-containing protein [Bacteroidales bacterium]|nr:DUF4832 domain-containing protein [Bacteroidales bacterium]